jgi:phospholipid/cholesterol/gamma-HCH transport system permease protein
MPHSSSQAAALSQPTPQQIVLSGRWTALDLGPIESRFEAVHAGAGGALAADGSAIVALDSAGAWVLQTLLTRLRTAGALVRLEGLSAADNELLATAAQARAEAEHTPSADSVPPPTAVQRLGRATVSAFEQAWAMLNFVGECAVAIAGSLRHPKRWRGRPILFNLRSAGFDALPIVGLLSFLLGVVVSYQGAAQLRQYGANIFVADLVGLSMLREFAPLITAIIVAGRSGSAYAAQIGTMSVTEEIDALRTLGIAPLELLVLPKLVALLIALPLLTVFADALGVFGGMIMARAQLDVGFAEFLDRFVKAVSLTSYWVGIAKAPVFAAIVTVIGCFQGFRTRGGADSVGRQTTRSVVQSIFLVIVADALFSVAFSALDL